MLYSFIYTLCDYIHSFILFVVILIHLHSLILSAFIYTLVVTLFNYLFNHLIVTIFIHPCSLLLYTFISSLSFYICSFIILLDPSLVRCYSLQLYLAIHTLCYSIHSFLLFIAASFIRLNIFSYLKYFNSSILIHFQNKMKNLLFKEYLFRPSEDGALYTLIVSNLDINTRKNRFQYFSF